MNVIKMPIIPNIEKLARELTGKSQIQIIINKTLSLKFLDKLVLVINNFRFLPSIFNREFAVGVKLLSELEILLTKKKSYIFHPQIVDMAIALNNRRIIDNFLYLSKLYNFTPYLMTNNLLNLINFLSGYKKLDNKLSVYFPKYQLSNKGLINFVKISPIKFIPIEND